MAKKKLTIAELEQILDNEENQDIEIMPDGSIRAKGKRKTKKKPLTLREDLGGEYSRLLLTQEAEAVPSN